MNDPQTTMISVLILTLNEEASLPACLAAVQWCDDVIVFDSFSTDRTVEIAQAAGARVFQRAFDNERDHRAASLRLPFQHPWVYNPDADEVTTPELRDEMRRVVAERARLERGLDAIPGVRRFPSAANFVLARVPDGPGAFEALKGRGILVRTLNGTHPLLAHCLRLTVGTSDENAKLLEALASILGPHHA